MSTRQPISEAHRDLGSLLRRARLAANVTTREMAGYSSGHISNVENGHVMPSRELIEAYKQLGADRIALHAAYQAAKKSTEDRRRAKIVIPQQIAVTSASDPELLRSRYEAVEMEGTYYIDSRWVITHVDNTDFIRALEPTRFYVRSAFYHSDRRRGVVSFEASTGCGLVRQIESDSGLVTAIYDVGRNLIPSEPIPHKVSSRIKVCSDILALPRLTTHIVTGAARYSIRAQFTAPALPEKVWWFRSTSVLDKESDPTPDSIFKTSQTGVYSHEFAELAGGEYCGLAWEMQ